MSGIWSGISNSIGWITSKVKQFARGILDGIKSALGIHSPSKVFEQEVGENMALGVGEGFINAMDSVKKEMQEAIPTDFGNDLSMSIDSADSLVSMSSDKLNLGQDRTNSNRKKERKGAPRKRSKMARILLVI